MTAWLLAFLLFQTSPAPAGFATGVVRSVNGSPASGVRVYAIPAGDPNGVSTAAVVIESLSQTDASGRYRLEIPAGRYYIAVGSVSSPSYFPDSTSIGSARAISIVAGTTVESVDFSRYTAATATPFGASVLIAQLSLPPGSTGVLSGVVRASDGSAASGITVHAVPVSVLSSPILGPPGFQYSGSSPVQQMVTYRVGGASIGQIVRGGVTAVTDRQGRYRIENVTPDTYKLMAGYSDSPVFYPGTSDIQMATIIATTSNSALTSLDFTLPPAPKTHAIRGRVRQTDGRPAAGSVVNLRSQKVGAVTGVEALLPSRGDKTSVRTAGDGTFEIPDVIPGVYALQTQLPGFSPLIRIVEVVDKVVTSDLDLSANLLTGRIVWEDGSPYTEAVIREVAVSTISNPNFIATTLFPVSNDGTFGNVMAPGDYRLYLRGLPEGYVVRVMASGSADLLKDPFYVVADVPNSVEIRVAKGLGLGTRVRGRVLDAVTGAAPVAERVELCCFTTGSFERLSTSFLPDGTFDFPAVPPGHYTAELSRKSGQSAARILNPTIDVGDAEKAGLVLISASQVNFVSATIVFEDGTNVPSSAGITVALKLQPGTNPAGNAPAAEVISVPLVRLADDTYWTAFPTSVRYTISVGNIPDGYTMKSISGPGATSVVPVLTADRGTIFSGFAPGVISIVLQRTPKN